MSKPSPDNQFVTFEQPMNEYMRLSLRLEKLFNQLKEHIHDPSIAHSRASLFNILKIIEIINRPDLKSKLTQALTQHACTLGQLEQFPQVDPERLHTVLKQLDGHIASLHNSHRKIAEPLLHNEFLNQIRLQMGTPGGINDEKAPAYRLWLSQPAAKRIQDLITWAQEFEELNNIIDLLLHLMRDSTPPQIIHAHNGYYHQTLDTTLPCELIILSIPASLGVFPEISVGKHRLNVRWLTPNFHADGRPVQVRNDIEFKLSCCRL